VRTERKTVQLGFTLIELLIVVAVLGILAAVVVFELGGVTAQSAVAACNANATTVETAVAAYNAQTGGAPSATTASLTAYLQSFPSSPDYTISIDSGVVMIAAPSTATPVAFGTPNACSGAGSTAATTTTTTSPPTTTTTTTAPPTSNGVTATPTSDNYNNHGGQERITVTNSSSITAMTISISVAKTTGVTHKSQSNSFPGGDLTQSSRTSGGVIGYTFVLKSRKSIPAGSSGIVYAQFNGTGSVHAMSGDTWRVTSTANGITTTLTGTF